MYNELASFITAPVRLGFDAPAKMLAATSEMYKKHEHRVQDAMDKELKEQFYSSQL